jgi:glycyl-tRNA synthetase alpha chain
VIDHTGQVTASLPPLTQGVLDATVQGRTGLTPYARVGVALRPVAALGAGCAAGRASAFDVRETPSRIRAFQSCSRPTAPMLSFQQIILKLQDYWSAQGCALLQALRHGSRRRHQPHRDLPARDRPRALEGRLRAAEPPPEGRPLRREPEPAAALLPVPGRAQAGAGRTSSSSTSGSLEALGFDLKANDIRFVEDDWENPTLGCWGLGWEVWLNGMEVTQFTYFQQVGGIDCKPITGEITYGLERLGDVPAGRRQRLRPDVDRRLSYGDVYKQNEVEQSTYNFEHSDVEFLLSAFGAHEKQSKHLMEQQLALPAYEQLLKAGHSFNLLDARGAISVTERAAYIGRIRNWRRRSAQSYLDSRARLGFPDGAEAWADEVCATREEGA